MGIGGYFPGIKRPGLEADQTPLSRAQVKNEWSHTSILPFIFMACGVTTLLYFSKIFQTIFCNVSPITYFCIGDGSSFTGVLISPYPYPRRKQATTFRTYNTVLRVDKKNQLDVTFCILYFSSNSCSTCFGQPCAHHQELTTT